MKRYLPITAFLFISLLIPLQFGHAYNLTLPKDTPIQVYFSSNGGCTDAINKALGQAKSEIFVQAYSFTSASIAKALFDAQKRGGKVQVILDKSQRTQKYSSATFLKSSRIPTFIDDRHAIAHNKIMIIDREIVITGSFNFTKVAEEKNAKSVSQSRIKPGEADMENWERHREHSERYERK
jgi:phosphatidylserine/phosphatidylglycerophosphate/cardiolipin synthase-like enzyme